MPGSGRTPSGSAIAAPTSARSVIGARSIHHAPSGNRSNCSSGHLEGEPRLAAPSRAAEGHEPGLPEDRAQLGQLAIAAYEARKLRRQIAGEIGAGQRERLLEASRVPELMGAKVDEGQSRRQAVDDEVVNGARNDDLALARDRSQG